MSKKYQNITIVFLSIFLLSMLSTASDSWSYNKSWDQGHQCVNPSGGSSGWGRYDYDGIFQGGYTSKECCEILCKICPVYANTGRLQKTYTDLTVPGIGPALNIVRTYDSQEWATSLLGGHGWIFKFGKELIIIRNKAGEKIIGVRLETGEKNFFKENTDGTLERLTDYGATYVLTKNADGTYTIKNRDGSRHELRSDGKISKIVDKNNNQLIFEYSSVGCVSKITNESGNYVSFQLGPNGKIATISDNLGRTITYSYDQNGNLTAVSDPMGNTSQYVYNSDNLLTQIVDARGNVVESATYDNNRPPRVSTFVEKGETYTIAYFDGRTVKTDSQGNSWTYYYNDVGVITKVIDPLGTVKEQLPNKITSTSLDWEEDLNGNRTTYTWDTNGNMTSKTDPLGNTTTYTYVTGTNLVATETNPLGVVAKYEYDPNGNQTKIIRDFGGPLQSTTTYTYDIKGNKIGVTDPLGHTTRYEYDITGNLTKVIDPLGNATTYTYDSRGNRLAETDPLGNATTHTYDLLGRLSATTDALGRATTYAYDGNGNRVSQTDARGNTTLFSFDAYGRMIQTTDPLGNVTSYTYNHQDKKTSLTDSNGNTLTYTYDAAGRMTGETNPLGGRTTYAFDSVGNLLSVTDSCSNTTVYTYDVANRKLSEKTPLGETTIYAYDAAGRVIRTTYANGNIVTNTYDSLGRVIRIADSIGTIAAYTYDAADRFVQQTDGIGSVTTNEYDGAGRLIKQTDALGNHVWATYDAAGRTLTVTDREGNTTSRACDALGRQTSLTDALGNTTHFAYDEVGNLISIVDARGNSTGFSYDKLNRRNKKTYADGRFVQWVYDPVGNVVSKTDEGGRITNYTYDALNRRIQESWIATGRNNNFAYDCGSRLAGATNPSSAVSFVYDGSGRLIETTQDDFKTWRQYDVRNRTVQITYPDGGQVLERWDYRGRIAQVDAPSLPLTVNYTRDGLGQAMSVNYSTGLRLVTPRDAMGLITGVQHTSGQSLLLGFDYSRNKEGHKLNRGNVLHPEKSEAYNYDSAYQVLTRQVGQLVGGIVQNPTSFESFEYDGAGNIVKRIVDGVTEIRTYNELNEILTANGSAFAHDAHGNVTDDGERTYAYDEDGQLLQVTRNSDSQILIQCEYDALRRRVKKTSYVGPATEVVRFVYDGASFRTIAEADASGSLVKTYVWGSDISGTKDGAGGVGGLLAMKVGGDTFGYGYDDLGNMVALYDLDDSNAEAARYRYSAFGLPVERVGSEAESAMFRFSTKYFDSETELYYYGYRYYSPEIGRWLSRDPKEEEGGNNLYVFVYNAPINAIDPLGDIPVWMERLGKELGFQAWRAFVVTAPEWRAVLDAWYYETGPNPVTYSGIADPRNASIASNPGFVKLLNCWIAKKRGESVPSGAWQVENWGFQWQYTYSRSNAAGGFAAYRDETEFLGTYSANVTDIGSPSSGSTLSRYQVHVWNRSGWTSGTRLPGFVANALRQLGWSGTSIFYDHARGGARYTPSRGGNLDQNYDFVTEADRCADCVLP